MQQQEVGQPIHGKQSIKGCQSLRRCGHTLYAVQLAGWIDRCPADASGVGSLLHGHCAGCKRDRAVSESVARTIHTALQDGWLREVDRLSSRGLSSQAAPIHRVPSCPHVCNARGHRACLHRAGQVSHCRMAAVTETRDVPQESWHSLPEATVDPRTGSWLCHCCMQQVLNIHEAPRCPHFQTARGYRNWVPIGENSDVLLVHPQGC